MGSEPILMQALIHRISTTIDGGWTVAFSLNQSEANAILKLSELRDQSLVLVVQKEPEHTTLVD